MSKLLIKNIGTLATPTGSYAKSGDEQASITILHDSAVVVSDGNIVGVYDNSAVPNADYDKIIDACGKLVTPGLVDAHTHLVFGGWREHEVPLKLRGASYLEILAAGGGILDTVVNTREASYYDLLTRSRDFINNMMAYGTTTCEAKSGYGLDMLTEIKQLEVIRSLRRSTPMDIVPTYMGAHATPPEYAGNTAAYVDYICESVLPQLARDESYDYPLAVFCDVFCETGVFDVAQSERILSCAKKHGFIPKIHADEIDVIGAVPLACQMSAISADHLIAIDQTGISALSRAAVIATLLPQTSFYLGKQYAPAREMIKNDIPVAIASDFNPGSCPSSNLQFAINLAYLKYKMTPSEILTAVTLNAACAIDMAEKLGTIETGKQADLIIWDAPNLEMLCYRLGGNLVKNVIKKGEVIC